MAKMKSLQVDYTSDKGAHVTIAEGEAGASATIGAGPDAFISVTDKQSITVSPARGERLNMQLMPNDMIFGGMFSMSSPYAGLVPSTVATPNPHYRLSPPFAEIMSTLREVAVMTSSFVG